MAQSDEAEEQPKKSKKKLIIIIVAVLLLLAAAGGGAFIFLSGGSEEGAEEVVEEVSFDDLDAIYIKLRTFDGRPMFVASLKNERNQRHFIQIYAEAITRDVEAETILNEHMPLFVARLNSFFSTTNPDRLRKVEDIKAFQAEATEIVNRLVVDRGGQPTIEQVIFTDFVMQ